MLVSHSHTVHTHDIHCMIQYRTVGQTWSRPAVWKIEALLTISLYHWSVPTRQQGYRGWSSPGPLVLICVDGQCLRHNRHAIVGYDIMQIALQHVVAQLNFTVLYSMLQYSIAFVMGHNYTFESMSYGLWQTSTTIMTNVCYYTIQNYNKVQYNSAWYIT